MRQRDNTQPTSALIAILCTLTLALLQACQPSGPDSPFKRYLGQLDLAVSVARPITQITPVPPRPETSELLLDISRSMIDGLDFLQLSGCAVQTNIGKRQTSLGQFAKPSQLLLLDLEYLRLAPACIRELRAGNKQALADQLETARLEKQRQLPTLIFNATLGSDEYQALWGATPAPSDYPRSSGNAMLSALETMNRYARRWLNGDYRAQNRDIELLLSEIAGGDAGNRLQDWSRQIDWLASANRMLEQRLASGALCREQKPDPTARKRTAIAHAYFISVIQPLTTQSKQRLLQVISPIRALEAQLNLALPTLYRRWVADRSQRIATLAHAPDNQLKLLSRIQQACKTE